MATHDPSDTYEFTLKAVDPKLSADDARRILAEAVADAAQAMARDGQEVDARAEIAGAFGGVGETIVILLIAAAKGAAGAVGAAGGKQFYERYLKPRLQKKNLVVSDLKPREPKDT
jgi:hypothetical protein